MGVGRVFWATGPADHTLVECELLGPEGTLGVKDPFDPTFTPLCCPAAAGLHAMVVRVRVLQVLQVLDFRDLLDLEGSLAAPVNALPWDDVVTIEEGTFFTRFVFNSHGERSVLVLADSEELRVVFLAKEWTSRARFWAGNLPLTRADRLFLDNWRASDPEEDLYPHLRKRPRDRRPRWGSGREVTRGAGCS